MMFNQQSGSFFFQGANKLPAQPSNTKNVSINPTDPYLSHIQGIINLIISKKYSEALSQSSKLKLPALVELTRIAYQHNLMWYLLHTRDKIFQVAPEQNLMTETGMLSLRILGAYREEAGQAKAIYASIAENIKKLASSSNYFQCTLPNRQELTDIKSALIHLFQQNKNKNKQIQPLSATHASSQATQIEKDKDNPISQSKQCLLQIISLLMPTQTMKSSVNREKSIQELSLIAKSHIRDTFQGFKHELELVQSRAHYCEKTLQKQRSIKSQKEKQLEVLKEELVSSQKYIAEIEGLHAATEMENLGLHSQIRLTQDSERGFYEGEIERLRMENEELHIQIEQKQRLLEDRNFQMQQIKCKNSYFQGKIKELESLIDDLTQKNEKLVNDLQNQHTSNTNLECIIVKNQHQIKRLQQQLFYQSDNIRSIILHNSELKIEKQHLQAELFRLERLHSNSEELSEELTKLREEAECLLSQNTQLTISLKQEDEHRINSDNMMDQLHKLLQESEQQRLSLQHQIEALINQIEHYSQALAEAHDKIEQMQINKITENDDTKETSVYKGKDAETSTIVTLQDLKAIEESLLSFAERQNQLDELYLQNQRLKRHHCDCQSRCQDIQI